MPTFDSNFHRNYVSFDLHEPGYLNIHNSTGGNIALLKICVFSGGVAGDNDLKNTEVLSSFDQLIAGIAVGQYTGVNNAIDIVGPIADGFDGILCGMGTIFDLDTSSLTGGADVYTDTSGNLTSTITLRKVGFCIVSDASAGQLYIDVVGEKGEQGDPGAGGDQVFEQFVHVDDSVAVSVGFNYQSYSAAAVYAQSITTPSYFLRWTTLIHGGITEAIVRKPYIFPTGNEGEAALVIGNLTDDDVDGSFGAYQTINCSYGSDDPNKISVVKNSIINDQKTTVNGGSLWLYSSDLYTFGTPNMSTLAEIGILEGSTANIGNFSKVTMYDGYLTMLGSVGNILNMYSDVGQLYLTQATTIGGVFSYGGTVYGGGNVLTLDTLDSEIMNTLLYGVTIVVDGVTLTTSNINANTNGVIITTINGGVWNNIGGLYNPSSSGLLSNDEQSAIDELRELMANDRFEDDTERSTTLEDPNWADYLPVAHTTITLPAGDYRLDTLIAWNLDNIVKDAQFQILLDGVVLNANPINQESKDPNSIWYLDLFEFVNFPTKTTHTLQLQYRIESGAGVDNLTVHNLKFHTWRTP